jgi:hypothetical protein
MIRTTIWIVCFCFFSTLAFADIHHTSKHFQPTDSTSDIDVNLSVRFFDAYLDDIYRSTGLETSGLDVSVFKKAVTGYFNLKGSNKIPAGSSIIAIADLSQSSCTKRFWLIDLQKRKLLLNTWVAHGQNSGDDIPDYFSNDMSSYASSLGFYVTDNIYMGKHGRSLKLNGMDEGFNDNAIQRDIVLHAAAYVGEGAIKALGRLGRSQGCPAVPLKEAGRIIELLKGKNVLFINGNDSSYSSDYLNTATAAQVVFHGMDQQTSSIQ